MFAILSITFPIFLLIGLGAVATRRGVTTAADIRGIGVFVIRFALPAMLFHAMAQRPIAQVFDARYLVIYALGSLAAFALVFTAARLIWGKGLADGAMMALGSANSNSGFIGYPIAALAVGPEALVALSMTLIVENVVVIPLALGLAESSKRASEPLHRVVFFVLGRLARNPMMLGIVVGAAVSLTGLPVPQPLTRAIDLLAEASTAAALFAIGGTLAGLRATAMGSDLVAIVTAKLLLHPLAVWTAVQLLPSVDPGLARAMVIFAAGPMFSVYALISQPYGCEHRSAAALLGATSLSFVTLTVLLVFI